MRTENKKLAAELLAAGKHEFLEKGFQGASMRSIAASLGVTTGAIYGYYTDKEAMFDALVAEPARELVDRMRVAGYAVPEMDDELIHIMSTALFNGMFETVRHDMPQEKARKYMDSLRDFYSAGWFKILGISNP